ncbi:xylulokinase [Kiloniella laminariae]|uniref:xylulokinase n=1 Tax=Kiloniella laminariae TaxID=454162 RepID=UPI0004773065|nr:xylulokinase [Kiloniella laminariae]
MYLGLDIGTSGIKAVICDPQQDVVAQVEIPLTVTRPKPLWSEQNPEDWWQAVQQAFAGLQAENPRAFAAVKAIGLAGQMHGAVLLDREGQVLRPAILWNDGRCSAECALLEQQAPDLRRISGNIAMPGFTAPKLLWVARYEPEIFEKIATVLLPKDYIRFCLTGDYVSDMSDAAGTLWLDVAARDWSDELLSATGMSRAQMPRLIEGCASSGTLLPAIVRRWGFSPDCLVAGGAGDNAAGAIGLGAVKPGQAFLSLGTSGVLFVCNDKFSPNPADAVHAFCHCLPQSWHQMSVILSAASCVGWVTRLAGAKNEVELLSEIAVLDQKEADQTFSDPCQTDERDAGPLFLPYLSGERTPHNDPQAQGVFFGLTHETDRAVLGRAVLEGVAFAFADGLEALLAAGGDIDAISVIGGGARSSLWGQILANTLGRELHYHVATEVGPAFGAARLARLAAGEGSIAEICVTPEIRQIIRPDPQQQAVAQIRLTRYRDLYQTLKGKFAA